MKKLAVFVLLFTAASFAQFKDSGFPEHSVKEGIFSRSNSSSLLSFLNSDNFQMRHSVSISYESFGNYGMALGVYTNSMFYKFNDNLNAQMDVSFVHSPYNNLGKNFSNNINGLYISKAAVNFRPWKDFLVTFQYRNMPYSNNYYSRYGNGFGSYNSFFNDDVDNPFFGR